MVDISEKSVSSRTATACGRVLFTPEGYAVVRKGGLKKGDIATVAELAGIMGAKRTADLIALCHPLPLTGVTVTVTPDDTNHAFDVMARVKTTGRTGVEMEALTAVMTACLNIYDMAKAVDKSMTIDGVQLVEKTGGASGDFRRDTDAGS